MALSRKRSNTFSVRKKETSQLATSSWKEKSTHSSCDSWHPPDCAKYKTKDGVGKKQKHNSKPDKATTALKDSEKLGCTSRRTELPREPTDVVYGREKIFLEEIPEWLQPFTEGLMRKSSSSTETDESPLDVAIPPPGILLSAHSPAKPISNKSGGKHNLVTHFRTIQILKSAGARKLRENSLQKENPENERDIICDMITGDLKIIDEERARFGC